ncbi:MAG: AAA family ATPase [Phycisphaerales bacterium]|nr:AAA family ATPase [Phycisphaerales bacterium]
MKLKAARITNYKCIKDSTEFSLDEKITCLVGKNEAGKTAILEALAKLKPTAGFDGNFDVTRDYPRHELSDYEASHERNPAVVVCTTWELEEGDYSALEDVVGPAARTIGAIRITKNYNNAVYLEYDLDEEEVIKGLLEEVDFQAKDRTEFKGVSTVSQLVKQLGEPSEQQQQQQALAGLIQSRFGEKSPRDAARDVIWQRTPSFAFFSQYLRMPGQLAVNAFNTRVAQKSLTEEDRVFESLLAMIGMTVEKFAEIDNYEELSAKLEAAENKLTRELVRYWSQSEYLKMRFRFEHSRPGDEAPFNEGWILRTRIENTRHGATTGFDQRSSGFIWFFSFLVWFNQLRRNIGGNLIVLLDEPGLALHASAQADLLRYIEERLSPTYQVAYTTHSPFMIDASDIMRTRTVEDVYQEVSPEDDPDTDPHRGTKVSDQILRADHATLFPLRACLGYEITQTLFISKYNVLVEGPSDLLYIDWFRRKLAALGRATLDPRWTVTPCGSVTKIAAFMNLFGGNDLECAVVCDFADGSKGKVRELQESELLKAGRVLTIDAYANRPEADIEDLLGDNAYVDLVNQCYSLEGGNIIMPPKVADGATPGRIMKYVEEHFRVMPPEIPELNHTDPADFMVRQGLDIKLPELDAALERFEKLFADLNTILHGADQKETTPKVPTRVGRRSDTRGQ